MKKPTLTEAETDEMVRWAAQDQSRSRASTSSPTARPIARTCTTSTRSAWTALPSRTCRACAFGDAGFGIECPRVIGEIENPRFHLAHNWKLARDAAPAGVRVKQTVTGPHVLTRFSVNERKDLYPDEQALCRAWAGVLRAGT